MTTTIETDREEKIREILKAMSEQRRLPAFVAKVLKALRRKPKR